MSSIEPDDGGGEIDGRKEVLPAFVVACRNGSGLILGSGVLEVAHLTRTAIKLPSRALPRLRVL